MDDEMEISLKALCLVNDFRGKGYTTRRSFLQVISDALPEYCSQDGFNQLTLFWLGRLRKPEMNKDVETVLFRLKGE